MSEIALVTGGAGFIGSHVVDKLIEKGYHVRVLDNLDPQVHGSLGERKEWPSYCNGEAEYILGDIRNKDSFCKALSGVDVVFHLAAAVGVGQSMYKIQHYVDVNVNGTAVLLDILANEKTIRNRVRKIIVASSMSNYGEGEYVCPVHGEVFPQLRSHSQLEKGQWELLCSIKTEPNRTCGEILTPRATRETKPLYTNSIYAITKQTQESTCLTIGEAYRIPAIALRYFNTYGTRQALSNPYTGVAANFSSRLINHNAPMIFEDGQQQRDFIHISDLIQANMLVLDHEDAHGVYNVGSGKPITILEAANIIANQLESPLRARVLEEYRMGDIRHCYADISKLKALGYEPKVDFEMGVKELVSWVGKQKAVDSFDRMKTTLTERGLTI
ncbi:MAG: SDR family NAD(P)-dependent oxidoreductase [Bacteroidetes bacterium]|nr:SDR family NAD(P)-dependent oxidoreductase [Bacteroidota bacterium]